MAACSAVGCTNRHSKKIPSVTYHRFPKNVHLLKQWIVSLRREHWMPSKYSRLCSQHFLNEDFEPLNKGGRHILKKDAVPSIFYFSKSIKKPNFFKLNKVKITHGNKETKITTDISSSESSTTLNLDVEDTLSSAFVNSNVQSTLSSTLVDSNVISTLPSALVDSNVPSTSAALINSDIPLVPSRIHPDVSSTTSTLMSPDQSSSAALINVDVPPASSFALTNTTSVISSTSSSTPHQYSESEIARNNFQLLLYKSSFEKKFKCYKDININLRRDVKSLSQRIRRLRTKERRLLLNLITLRQSGDLTKNLLKTYGIKLNIQPLSKNLCIVKHD